jgi:hypothetical protein
MATILGVIPCVAHHFVLQRFRDDPNRLRGLTLAPVGLVPAISIGKGAASPTGMAGPSPAMTAQYVYAIPPKRSTLQGKSPADQPACQNAALPAVIPA